jgi:ABC-type Na+ efflux pump permease subunit
MFNNPVLYRELKRVRLRQPTPARLGILLTIGLIVLWVYWLIFSWLRRDAAFNASSDTAATAWAIVVSLQYLLVCLVAPSVTANAITQEKEQQTWEMLVFSRLLPGEIILGKLFARMVTVLFVILLFLPIALFCCLHAQAHSSGTVWTHVSWGQFWAVYIVMLISGVFFATFGLYMSWRLKRTIYALMATYTFVGGGLVIGTALLTSALTSLTGSYSFFEKCPLMWINPIQMMSEAMSPNRPDDTLFLLYGLFCYILATLLMLWRMIVGFRRTAYE